MSVAILQVNSHDRLAGLNLTSSTVLLVYTPASLLLRGPAPQQSTFHHSLGTLTRGHGRNFRAHFALTSMYIPLQAPPCLKSWTCHRQVQCIQAENKHYPVSISLHPTVQITSNLTFTREYSQKSSEHTNITRERRPSIVLARTRTRNPRTRAPVFLLVQHPYLASTRCTLAS